MSGAAFLFLPSLFYTVNATGPSRLAEITMSTTGQTNTPLLGILEHRPVPCDDANDMPIILVVDDVEETRDGIEILLRSDGYLVESARSENGAIEMATHRTPELVLINLGTPPEEAVETARRVREQGVPDDAVISAASGRFHRFLARAEGSRPARELACGKYGK